MNRSLKLKLYASNYFNSIRFISVLAKKDPELYNLIELERNRQFEGLELIASENFTSDAVMEANGSCLTNKYSEGLPGARYYGGNEFIDKIENLCKERALKAFDLNPDVWGVNVQPYSGSPANFAVYTGLLQPHDRIMGLDLPSGGHLTHGYQTAKKKISATSIFFESMPYQVDSKTGYIDYESLKKNALLFKPKMIICGGSAYPREYEYETFRQIANENAALLFCDMSHFGGLIAAKVLKSPFDYCDVVTTTTHKTLRGPRAGMIFFRKKDFKGILTDYETKINMAVFPGIQGGPHNNTIAAIATSLKEASSSEFKNYAQQVIMNSQTLAKCLADKGYKIVTGGTDNHLILWDLRPAGLTGNKFELLCDMAHITVNKNAIHGDTSALTPGGVRLGSPALTSRNMKEKDFEKVAEFLHRCLLISLSAQKISGKKIKDFTETLSNNEIIRKDIMNLKEEVISFSKAFYMPGSI